MSTENIGGQGSFFDFLSGVQMSENAKQLTRMPVSILREAEKASEELLSLLANVVEDAGADSKIKNYSPSSRPQLSAPRILGEAELTSVRHDESQLNSRSQYSLLSAMVSVLENGTLKKIAFNAHSAAMRDATSNASKEQLRSEYESACNAVTDALNELDGFLGQLSDLDLKVSGLEEKVLNAEAVLGKLTGGSLEYEAALRNYEMLRVDLVWFRSELVRVENQVNVAESNAESMQEEVDELLLKVDSLDIPLSRSTVLEDQSNIARMLMLMTKLGEMMLKAGGDRAEAQRSILKLQEELRLKKLIKDAEKADKELQKAEAMNKAMGCIGKILGVLVTAVGLIGAFFTGGASLVLAGVICALMFADGIYEGVTGNSFIQEAMKPLTKLLQPILQFVMEKISGVLETFGVDAQTAKMAAMIVVSVMMAVVVVALMLTGVGGAVANVAGKILSKLGAGLTKVLENTIKRLVPGILKKAVTKMGGEASKLLDAVLQRLGLSSSSINREVYGQRMVRLAATTNFVKESAKSGTDVFVQFANLDVAKAVASMRFTMSELDLLNDMFSNILEKFQKSFSASQGIFARASEVITRHTNTGTAVARNIHGVRSA
jgi:invasin B